jgi:hypothetical protein
MSANLAKNDAKGKAYMSSSDAISIKTLLYGHGLEEYNFSKDLFPGEKCFGFFTGV